MEFRLVYDGKLPAESRENRRTREKHEIRRAFSDQLAELWRTHPRLRRALEGQRGGAVVGGVIRMTLQHHEPVNRFGRNLLPLFEERIGVGCSLDILFLRREKPGVLISESGDIDNRLKVLFDALRMPRSAEEVIGEAAADGDPFYCLLEDDLLITEVKVTTDRLLTPRGEGEHVNDVRLVIHVKSVVIDSTDLGAIVF